MRSVFLAIVGVALLALPACNDPHASVDQLEELNIPVECAKSGAIGETIVVKFPPEIGFADFFLTIQDASAILSFKVNGVPFDPARDTGGPYVFVAEVRIDVSTSTPDFTTAAFTYVLAASDPEEPLALPAIVDSRRVIYTNTCEPPPPPAGGIRIADLPDYVIGMKFFKAGADDYQLYGFNGDGTGEQRITDNAFRDRAPQWSPDGLRCSFASNRGGTSQDSYDLWIAEGTVENVRRLTNLGLAGSEAPRFHSWSRDGLKICFVAGRDLWVIDVAPGSAPTRVTQGPEDDGQPSWSQDSTEIAFVRDSTLWIMNADGSNARQVLDNVFLAVWSRDPADGRRIAVMRGTGLFLLEPDDSLTPWGDNTATVGDALVWTGDGIASFYAGELSIIRETDTLVVPLAIDPLAETEGLTAR